MGYYRAGMPNPMHDPRYAEFRALLVAAREEAGLTQTSLAERLCKPQSYVSKYERGERRLDVIETTDIARALGVDLLKIVDRLMRRIS